MKLFVDFCMWMLGGMLLFSFVVCTIVFTLAYIWGKIEEQEDNQ